MHIYRLQILSKNNDYFFWNHSRKHQLIEGIINILLTSLSHELQYKVISIFLQIPSFISFLFNMKGIRQLFLYIIFSQNHFIDVQTDWPSIDQPTIDLLGLFPDAPNTTQPTTLSTHPEAMFKAAILLSQQYNIKIRGKYIGWQMVSTGGDVMNCFKGACKALPNSSIVGIVGPAYSRETDSLAAFAGTINLPVISYSATNTDLSDRSRYKSFFRTVSSDKAAALAMVDLFIRYNWTLGIIIYQNDAFGTGGARVISEAFNDNGLSVDQTIIYNINTLTLQENFKSLLLASPSRIVIMWTSEPYTQMIVQTALDADVLGPQFTWILSSDGLISVSNKTLQQKLVGILAVEPVTGSIVNATVNTTLLNIALNLWQQYHPETYPSSDAISYYAYFAFDATWTYIKALQQYCSTISNESNSCLSITAASECLDSSLTNGDDFINTISTTEFLGISGPIKFSMDVTDRLDGIYYVASNIQSTIRGLVNIPVLVWSSSARWEEHGSGNAIIWPGSTTDPPDGLPSISGIRLRVAVYLVDPFTMIKTASDNSETSGTTLIGYIPDLINLLVDQLGFIPEIKIVPGNHTYNSLVDGVVNGIYDIVIADVTVTASRTERVSFSNSIFDNSLRVIIRKRTITKTSLTAFLSPLSVQLWMVLLLVMIFAGLLICVFERQHNEMLQNRTIFGSLAMSIYYSFGNIVGYGAGFDVKTSAGRLVTVALYALSIVIVATYTANLASNLTIMKSADIVSGIDDIKNGKVLLSRVGIMPNSSIEAYYLREISGSIKNYYPLKEADDIFRKLLSEDIDAAIMDSGILEYATSNTYCNLTLVGVGVDESVFGIVMPKNWLYARNFDYTILSLRESGELDTLKSKWFRGTMCSNSDSDAIVTATSIDSISGLFMIFGIILFIAIIVYIWEGRHYVFDDILQTLRDKKMLRKKAPAQDLPNTAADFSEIKP